jgi:hypothetical protein
MLMNCAQAPQTAPRHEKGYLASRSHKPKFQPNTYKNLTTLDDGAWLLKRRRLSHLGDLTRGDAQAAGSDG